MSEEKEVLETENQVGKEKVKDIESKCMEELLKWLKKQHNSDAEIILIGIITSSIHSQI